MLLLEPAPCLASGRYTLTLTLQDDAGIAACDGYAGSTAVVSLVNLHYVSTGPSAGFATIDVTRSPSTQPEVWLHGPGWPQFSADHGAQCYDNYSIAVVTRPR